MAKTVEQVARALEISITTVRLVLGGKAEQYRISAKTQQRINDYIAENGLVVNHSIWSFTVKAASSACMS